MSPKGRTEGASAPQRVSAEGSSASRPKVHAVPMQAAEAAFEEHGAKRMLAGRAALLVAGVALAFSSYQLVIAAFSPLSSLPSRSIHVGFLLALAFLIHPVGRRASRERIAWYDALLAAVGFGLAFYHLFFEADLVVRSGDPTLTDLAVGTLFIVLLFEASRRVLGPALPVICAAFLFYGLLGQHLPAAVAHRGYGFDQIVSQLFLGTEGVFGIPTLVSATYIFLFILFGSFLEHAGMVEPVQQHRAGVRRPRARRCGEGLRGVLEPDGHDLRLGRGQRADHGPVHDPADEALRLFAGVRGCRRGDLEHGRPDHAAGDGCSRVHHGRDPQRPLRDDRQGRAGPGTAVLRDGVLDGAPRGRARRT